jgi:hypothetical protein
MWQPTAAAQKVYQDLVTNHINEQIVTTFGYLGKKTIALVWVWGGQRFSYGNNLDMQITLLSELSGLINADTRSVSNNADYSMSMIDAIKKTEKYYGVDKYDIVKYSDKAAKDLKEAKIQNQYGRDQTFVGEVNKIVKENGNYVFSTNILTNPSEQQNPQTKNPSSKLVIFTPFSYEGSEDTVLDGATRSPNLGPDPTKRYGYLLGPSVFNTLERSFNWAPPQQITQPTPAKQSTPVGGGKKKPPSDKTPATNNANIVAENKGAVRGSSSASSNPGIRVQQDKVGPNKQILQQLEGSSALNLHTFLVPALVGIKPYDIVYVPSLNAKDTKDIEDWVVTSVDYNQTDGGVEVSITATRPYGTGATLMNPTSGEKFLKKAQTLTTLEKWEAYAWDIKKPAATPSKGPVSSSTGLPADFAVNGTNVVSVIDDSTGNVIGAAKFDTNSQGVPVLSNVNGVKIPQNFDFSSTDQPIPVLGAPGETNKLNFIDPLSLRRIGSENIILYDKRRDSLSLYASGNDLPVSTFRAPYSVQNPGYSTKDQQLP